MEYIKVPSRDVPIRFFLTPIRSRSESFNIPIRYSALTNIFLDNTAALTCIQVVPLYFFMSLKHCIYLYMALSDSAYAITTLASTFLVLAGECVTLHCDSRPSCSAAEVCETQPTLGSSISSVAFYKFPMHSCKMTWTRCLSISHAVSVSSIACFTCFAVWDPRN